LAVPSSEGVANLDDLGEGDGAGSQGEDGGAVRPRGADAHGDHRLHIGPPDPRGRPRVRGAPVCALGHGHC